ncbi:AAA family ATPase [Variovorax sp. HJSM1_2]|uniref:AAA family ATPase n=1 Tax=Variovorax sp. HJSM1_2 TaxID=3366263 RepID=UPI003BDB1FBB
MSLVKEIAEWADAQYGWMSHAVRLIVEKGTLSEADHLEIAELMKVYAGLGGELEKRPIRIKLDDLPVAAAPGVNVSLTGLRQPRNINAIGFDDGITFASEGLTVVYGYNGSGKSGYARALKKACRARYTESILPNVFKEAQATGPVEATFEWLSSGKPGNQKWVDGSASPADLSRVAIFDAHCARVFVDEQADVSFVPYGMDILRELSHCMEWAQRHLEKERQSHAFDRSLLGPFVGSNTDVGRFVTSISSRTDPKTVDALASLTVEEQQEIQDLVKLLADGDRQKTVQELRRLAQRCRGLEQELEKLTEPLQDDRVTDLQRLFDELKGLAKAVEMASAAMKDGALPGTGTEPWVILMRSAVEFASQAYPQSEFPGPHDANCVLCQQPLGGPARERLNRFWEFLQSDAQRRLDGARLAYKELYSPMKKAPVDAFPTDPTILDEIKERSEPLNAGIAERVATLKARHAGLLQIAVTQVLPEFEPLQKGPEESLRAFINGLLEQAAKIEAGLTPEVRQAKQKRLAELQDRTKLADHRDVVLACIKAAQVDALYVDALKCCRTNALTQKSGELYQKAITKELQEALSRELKALNVVGIDVSLDLTGQKGARRQQLKLAGALLGPKVKLSGVLSEGEQRAIAIASFLAEVSLEPAKSGIVFDDPVNSLDQMRRERIAKRLAEEAKHRQVIVFTHDLAFAWELKESAKASGHSATMRHVFSAGKSKGHCKEELPFEGQNVRKRVNLLKELHGKAKAAIEEAQDIDAYNLLIRDGYRRLRDSWELLVEEQMFNGTVRRFHRPISTLKLRSVSVEDDHVKSVYDNVTRTSYFAHEGGAEAPPPLPEHHEFLADVVKLEVALTAISNSNKAAEARRQAMGVSLN